MDKAVGKLLPQCFLGALCAYERVGVKNFTKKIVRQKSRVGSTITFELISMEIELLQILTISDRIGNLTCQKNDLAVFEAKV